MGIQVRRPPRLQPDWWRQRNPIWAVAVLLSGAVAAFSSLWAKGALLLDGRGIALYAHLSRVHVAQLGYVPYWLPEMWGGSPIWALGPSLPLFLLVPLTAVVGGDTAVKAAILVLQVVGGVGAYALARSLWGKGPAPVVAGLIYSLHPMIVAHGALLGLEGLLGVTAAAPWLAWSFRRALRGDGGRFVVAAGLISAVAVLHQAEYALGLTLLCGAMLVVELARPRDDPGAEPPRALLARAGGVVVIGLASVAFWLLPLIAMRNSFVLSPPELVQAELTAGAAAQVSNEIGIFFDRPSPLSGTVSYFRTGLFPQFFYVGLTCTVLTVVSLLLLRRRRFDGDRHLVAILVASALGMWMSTGSVPLIRSGPALRQQIVPLALTGLGAGLLLGCFLRHLHLGRFRILGLAAAASLLVAVPFATPYLTLQKVVPIFAVIRFPRFYTLAALGMSLGAAYPVAVFGRWLRERRDLRPLLPSALAITVAALFLIDILPYRADYGLRPSTSPSAYKEASDALPPESRLYRVAPGLLEPAAAASLIDNGWALSTGWPHPLAGRQLWRITGEAYSGPPGYREAAFGLSATAFVAIEERTGLGTAEEAVTGVDLVRNPRALPLLRSYEQVVVVDDADLSPLLATALAYRNVGVLSRRQPLGEMLAGMPSVAIESSDLCARPTLTDLNAVAGEVAIACAVGPWLEGLQRGTELVPVERRPGAVFTAQANGLRGISVWFDRPEGKTEVALHELGADGQSLGAELARAQAVGTDEYGLTAFTFDPIGDSAGRRFAFVLSCTDCQGEPSRLIAGTAEGGRGNLIDGGRLRRDRITVQTPIYDRVPPASTPGGRVTATGRGAGWWNVQVDAPNATLLVVAETWFPGWRAKVDGKSTPVVQADGAFLGVAMGPGQHVVEITYRRPIAADIGRVITLGTLFGLVVVGWRNRRVRGPVDDDSPEGPDPDSDSDESEAEAHVARPSPASTSPATTSPAAATRQGSTRQVSAGPSSPRPSSVRPGSAPGGRASPGRASPGRASPGPASPGSASPGRASPGPASPGSASPGPASPGPASPGSASPGSASPGPASPGPATGGAPDPATGGPAPPRRPVAPRRPAPDGDASERRPRPTQGRRRPPPPPPDPPTTAPD